VFADAGVETHQAGAGTWAEAIAEEIKHQAEPQEQPR
jgi:hypothetical protein